MNFGDIVLRIISGRWKGLHIKEVPSDKTRPTTDRNKETLFNLLGQYFDGGDVLDLFAGSGALGMEALSRGMDRCVFVDDAPDAIRTIRENLAKAKAQPESALLVRKDAFAYLRSGKEAFDLILADPPYQETDYEAILTAIHEHDRLKPSGIVVLEMQKELLISHSDSAFVLLRESISGNTKFLIYQRRE